MGECSQFGAKRSRGGVCPVLQAKSFPGYDAAGWVPSPQLGLHSDFFTGFLLFHITTIMKTPTTRERRFSWKTCNYRLF